ncbi:MAG TPA: isoprenylcysteine carboxylmethyltransferase family protein [Vicinamibacterales bacterium]|nr:isoprenylcysteine carboxylmethyltransferase family protein [Vicinamibacterales bacterium]
MSVVRVLARYRVALGSVMAVVTIWLARPSATTLAAGAVVAGVGEAVRLWAAGHVEKSREVTSSGPYRYTRHPLYLGSTLIGIGIAVAAGHLWLGLAIVAYLGSTLTAAMRAEEAHLRDKFGPAYDEYAAKRAPASARAFSWERAWRNREHHALAGLLAGLSLLFLKVWYSQGFVGR